MKKIEAEAAAAAGGDDDDVFVVGMMKFLAVDVWQSLPPKIEVVLEKANSRPRMEFGKNTREPCSTIRSRSRRRRCPPSLRLRRLRPLASWPISSWAHCCHRRRHRDRRSRLRCRPKDPRLTHRDQAEVDIGGSWRHGGDGDSSGDDVGDAIDVGEPFPRLRESIPMTIPVIFDN